MAFFHIPLPEFWDMVNNEPISGYYEDDVDCPKKNTGLFESMIK